MPFDYKRDFIKLLEKTSHRYDMRDVFSDFCAMSACALERLTHFEKDREDRYHSCADKYNKEELENITKLLAIVVDALDHKRESFLGPVLEAIGAANVKNQQFLTPASVANVMARITALDYMKTYKKGDLITLNDPSCGASVTLIAGAEALREEGVEQRDIFIVASDIDIRACDISFIELSLLGYSARIDRMDALSMKLLSHSRWTVPYFMYGTQWREAKDKLCQSNHSNESDSTRSEVVNSDSSPNTVQMELF